MQVAFPAKLELTPFAVRTLIVRDQFSPMLFNNPICLLCFSAKNLLLLVVAKMPKRKAVQSKMTNFIKTDKAAFTEDEKPSAKRKRTTVEEKDSAAKPMNKTHSDYSKMDLTCSKLSKEKKPWNFKISSWNVVSLKALVKKGGLEFVEKESPDIMCFQETKCGEKNVPEEAKLAGYNRYFVSGVKEGYAGVALYSKQKPLSVKMGLGEKEHDSEGRIITVEYEKFYLVTTYVPNAGRGLVTLPKRLSWNPVLEKHLVELDSKKPVILCGDLNVAHQRIDLKNPDTNTRSAGFTVEEREGMTALLAKGFVDSFRALYPDKEGAYTYWNYIGNARSRNTGWRLDYFVVSERLMPSVCDSVIRNEVYGSDHCPVTLFLSL